MKRRRLFVLSVLLCLRLSANLYAQTTLRYGKSQITATPSCSADPSQSKQWYDRKLDRLTTEFSEVLSTSNSHAPVQAALLERIYDLRDTVSSPRAVDSFVQAASENKAISPLARAEAGFLALQSALHLGDIQHVGSRYSALGYLRSWRITGEEFPIDAKPAQWKEFVSGPTPWLEVGEDLWPDASYITGATLDIDGGYGA